MTSVVDDQPPEEARRLEAFLGEWLVEGTLRSGQSTSAISGLWRFERAIDGWGLVGRMQTDIEGVGSFEEHELIGFGANDQCVHMCSANRYAIRDHLGTWTREDQLTVRYGGAEEGRTVSEEITLDFEAPGRITARVFEEADGSDLTITTDLLLVRRT
jgi:hypothetical protein